MEIEYENAITLKYTKTLDYFIIYILPYIEQYFIEYPTSKITLHTHQQEGNILSILFKDKINIKQIDKNIHIANNDIVELSNYLEKYYDIQQTHRLTKPLMICDTQFRARTYICIFPKYQLQEKTNNIDENALKTLIEKTDLQKYDKYIIGNPFERLNTRLGKDIDNFIDMLAVLKYAKIFITSFSSWYYIALLCNCRHVILYDTRNNANSYNPFNSHIYSTNNLLCNETYKIINGMLNDTKN